MPLPPGLLENLVALSLHNMSESAERRIAALAGQMEPSSRDTTVGPELQPTSAMSGPESACVVLPEKLSEPGPWRVHRSVFNSSDVVTGCQSCSSLILPVHRSRMCPERLTTSFPAPGEHIKTLYDCFEFPLSTHPEVRQLDRLSSSEGFPAQESNVQLAPADTISWPETY